MNDWARIGAKCVFVGGHPAGGQLAFYRHAQFPIAETPYTIRAIRDFAPHGPGYGVAIHLDEIINAPREFETGFHEIYWPLMYFRPLVDTDATIAALRQAAIDAVKNASGGAGIKRGVRV